MLSFSISTQLKNKSGTVLNRNRKKNNKINLATVLQTIQWNLLVRINKWEITEQITSLYAYIEQQQLFQSTIKLNKNNYENIKLHLETPDQRF